MTTKPRTGLFVALAGIDGSGKSTVAAGVAAALKSEGYDSECVSFRGPYCTGDPFVDSHLTELGRLIWPAHGGVRQDVLGDRYFLQLTAAWLELVGMHRVRPLQAQRKIIVADGWHHKVTARMALRTHINSEEVENSLAPTVAPDLTLLLDVNPTIAADRRQYFSRAEVGANDGETGDARRGFVVYQTKVRSKLRQMVHDTPGGVVIDADQRPEHVIDECARVIRSAIQQQTGQRVLSSDTFASKTP